MQELIRLSQDRLWRVVSRGACFNNAKPITGWHTDAERTALKLAALHECKLVLSFENTVDNGARLTGGARKRVPQRAVARSQRVAAP